MNEVLIDVREQDEFRSEHIPRSINIPLSSFGAQAPGLLSNFQDAKVILMCRSGKRAGLALEEARRLGIQPDGGFAVYEGGILAWKDKGHPTEISKKGHIPILRQTHLAAGLLALGGVILGFSVNPAFFVLSGAVGFGLTVAGATGLCLMSELLARAPWNRHVPGIQKEVCMATRGDSSCEIK